MKRTLLAVGIVALVSLLLVPYRWVQPTGVRRDPTGYARKSIPVQADKVSKIMRVHEVRPRKDNRAVCACPE